MIKYVIVLYGDRRTKRFNADDWIIFEPFVSDVAIKIYEVNKYESILTYIKRNLELLAIKLKLHKRDLNKWK